MHSLFASDVGGNDSGDIEHIIPLVTACALVILAIVIVCRHPLLVCMAAFSAGYYICAWKWRQLVILYSRWMWPSWYMCLLEYMF